MDSGRVVLFTLGGTISMTGQPDAVMPRLGGAELITAAGGELDVEVHDLRAVPSGALAFDDIFDFVDAATRAVSGGARGIVLTQGTDTLEETAFLIDMVWPLDAPVIVTGAMRNPTLPGADGPANLVAAVQVASSPGARGRGALVVFSDEIHASRYVRKSHSSSTATFTSPDLGPIGHVREGVPRFLATVPRLAAVSGFTRAGVADTRIALYTALLDDEATWLSGLVDTHAGLVVAGFGVGHVPASHAPVLGSLAMTMPVVLTSRTGAGPVFAATYGGAGTERDLRERGLISGGFLHPYKARVLLRLLVASGAGVEEIAAAFAQFA